MNYNKAIQVAGFMAIITVVGKFLGLIRLSILGSVYGTGPEIQAFLAASKVPLMLFDITIGGVISAAFIPIFNGLLTKDTKEKALKFANEYINFIIIITSILTIIGILFAESLIGFTLSGDEITETTRALAVDLSRIMFGMIIFTGVAYSFVGILNSNGQFYITSILSVISNGLVILYLLLSGDTPSVYGLAIVMLIGWSMQVVIQIPSVRKYGLTFRPTWRVMTPEMKSAMMLAGPILISSWAQPLSSLVNMRMASYLNGGNAVSALEYANNLYIVIAGIFGYVISNLSYPYLSKVAMLEDKLAIKGLVRTLVQSITFIITPMMVGLILLAIPITSLVFERNNFTAEDVLLTGTALTACAFGMLAFSYNEIFNKTFYAMNNSKIPMYTATVGIGVNILLSMILPEYIGIAGLGIAITTGTTITALLNATIMTKKLHGFFGRAGWLDVLKITIAVSVMAVVVSYVRNQFDHVFLEVCMSVMFGGMVYIGLCAIMRVSMMTQIIDFAMTKIRKGESDGE